MDDARDRPWPASWTTVADALPDDYDLGMTTFLLCGFELSEDAVAHGALIRRMREFVAERDNNRAAAT